MRDLPDLFATPVLPGRATVEDFVTPDEEIALIAAIQAVNLAPFRFQQWTGKRQTHSFGWHYDFEHGVLEPGEPYPGWLRPIAARAEGFAGLPPGALAQELVTRYDAGAGIGWHRDRPAFDDVVGVSLGHAATMRFRRRSGTRFERASLPLPPRGAYHLRGEARQDWEHSIAAHEATRWSITWRRLRSAHG